MEDSEDETEVGVGDFVEEDDDGDYVTEPCTAERLVRSLCILFTLA